MRTSFVVAILGSSLISGAVPAIGQKLYPLQGPLASQTPPPVFSGQVRRPAMSFGAEVKLLKSWTVANGEVLKGKCTEVTAASANGKTPGAPESYPPQPNLAFAWDAVFGPGYFAAHILGGKIWQGTFQGEKGTILQVEMHDSPEGSRDHYRGAAVDNKGNVYKVVW